MMFQKIKPSISCTYATILCSPVIRQYSTTENRADFCIEFNAEQPEG